MYDTNKWEALGESFIFKDIEKDLQKLDVTSQIYQSKLSKLTIDKKSKWQKKLEIINNLLLQQESIEMSNSEKSFFPVSAGKPIKIQFNEISQFENGFQRKLFLLEEKVIIIRHWINSYSLSFIE